MTYSSEFLKAGDLVAIDGFGANPIEEGFAYSFVRRVDRIDQTEWYAVVNLVCFDGDHFEDAPWGQQTHFPIGTNRGAHSIAKV